MHVEPFEEAIRSVLPDCWTLASRDRQLVLRRDRSVMFYSGSHKPVLKSEEQWQAFLEAYGFEGSFLMVLWFDRPLGEETLKHLAEQNRMSDKFREHMSEGLGKRVPLRKDHFHPETLGERALVDEFRLACGVLPFHRLPDINNEEFSVYLASSFDRGGVPGGEVAIHPAEVFEECRAVVGQVLEILGAPPAGP